MLLGVWNTTAHDTLVISGTQSQDNEVQVAALGPGSEPRSAGMTGMLLD